MVPSDIAPVRLVEEAPLVRTLVPVPPARLDEEVDAPREPAVTPEGLRELELIEPVRVLRPAPVRTPPAEPGVPPLDMNDSVVVLGP